MNALATEMNAVRRFVSAQVQYAAPNVGCMIGEYGHSTGDVSRSDEEETTMLKNISAALIAVSVLAAPALAGTPGKTVQAPLNKTMQTPAIKAEHSKSKAMNANARMDRHHKHYRHHRHHKHIGMLKTHAKPRVAIKHAAPVARRG